MAVRKATHYLDDDVRLWIEERRREHADDQIGFVDSILPVYNAFTGYFPAPISKVYDEILLHCGEPVSPQEIEKARSLDYNSVTTLLGRMAHEGIIRKAGRGRYFAAHEDFQRFHAVYHNPAWREWVEINRGSRKPGTIVDAFLHFQRNIMHAYFKRFFKGKEDTALLVTGKAADKNLRLLYDRATKEGFSTLWVDCSQVGGNFWREAASKIDISNEKLHGKRLVHGNHTDQSPEYFEGLLSSTETQYHLFLPEVDILFFRNDVARSHDVNSKLRRIWQEHQVAGKHSLNVYGSAENNRSKEFKHTLGTQKIGFYEGCWQTFPLEPVL